MQYVAYSVPASNLLRADYGAMARIAKQLGVSRSTVSKVIRGQRKSARVSAAIAQHLLQNNKALEPTQAVVEFDCNS